MASRASVMPPRITPEPNVPIHKSKLTLAERKRIEWQKEKGIVKLKIFLINIQCFCFNNKFVFDFI